MHRESSIRIVSTGLRGAVLPSLLALAALSVQAAQVDIAGPPGSVAFGTAVKVLPNGNFVVTDPEGGPVDGSGAVYLYSPNGALISTLRGGGPGDHVGEHGVVVVGASNFVVLSPSWYNDATGDVGAVTWVDGNVGLNSVVSPSNSLVGGSDGSHIGYGISVLSNANYVVVSPSWNNGTAAVGAVTWGDGETGVTGQISTSNSLVGTTSGDQIGYIGLPAQRWGITSLSNGNYVVASPEWDNGGIVNAGAVTLGDGEHGTVGVVSVKNSLVGSHTWDKVGIFGATALTNGNYVAISPAWNNDAIATTGAVTWGNGEFGVQGEVSTANSLVGATADDQVGYSGVTTLSNGNYVVASPYWDKDTTVDVGAATWADGANGTVGVVSINNSLVGSSKYDRVGRGNVYGKPIGVTGLTDGNFVVVSPQWNNGSVIDTGAVTWGDGTRGTVGSVSSSNSLVGPTVGSAIGSSGVTALGDGNYVVASAFWDDGGAMNVGAVTWRDGTGPVAGIVDSDNSLVGTTTDDHVGMFGVTAGFNGDYLVVSPEWNNGGNIELGALSWCRAGGATTGPVSIFNSLVGTMTASPVGTFGTARAFSDGNYVVQSRLGWGTGAVTLGSGKFRLTGTIAPWNSVIGGDDMTYDYDPNLHRLIVGRPVENLVSLFTMDQIFADGLEL